MTPNQKEDLDREVNYGARDYDKWKNNNADMLAMYRRKREEEWERQNYDQRYTRLLWIIGLPLGILILAIVSHWSFGWPR